MDIDIVVKQTVLKSALMDLVRMKTVIGMLRVDGETQEAVLEGHMTSEGPSLVDAQVSFPCEEVTGTGEIPVDIPALNDMLNSWKKGGIKGNITIQNEKGPRGKLQTIARDEETRTQERFTVPPSAPTREEYADAEHCIDILLTPAVYNILDHAMSLTLRERREHDLRDCLRGVRIFERDGIVMAESTNGAVLGFQELCPAGDRPTTLDQIREKQNVPGVIVPYDLWDKAKKGGLATTVKLGHGKKYDYPLLSIWQPMTEIRFVRSNTKKVFRGGHITETFFNARSIFHDARSGAQFRIIFSRKAMHQALLPIVNAIDVKKDGNRGIAIEFQRRKAIITPAKKEENDAPTSSECRADLIAFVDSLRITMNGSYLLGILDTLEHDEVRVTGASVHAPLFFKTPGKSFLLMPIRQ